MNRTIWNIRRKLWLKKLSKVIKYEQNIQAEMLDGSNLLGRIKNSIEGFPESNIEKRSKRDLIRLIAGLQELAGYLIDELGDGMYKGSNPDKEWTDPSKEDN